MKFQTILNLVLMAAIALLCLFHRFIWPCHQQAATNVANGVTVHTESTIDTTTNLVEATPIRPKKVTPAKTEAPSRPPAPVISANVTVPYVFDAILDSTGLEIWIDWMQYDSVFVNGTYYVPYDSVLQYHLTAVYDTTIEDTETDIRLQAFTSVSGNRLSSQKFLLQNRRATQNNTVNVDANDRFQVYFGPKFSTTSGYAFNAVLPAAGAELSMKFKTNTMLDVGYAVGPQTQIISLDVKQLIRFKKLGEKLRARKARKLAETILKTNPETK